ncbi:sugar phosphate nucleotidyltransferase [Paenibacillus sp. J2TS4]|uniref:sugar phosphate nucleotidyltransferase n=1 Tax=Paenibacillus sp. J2TS4 TaxID=2807194 RepID=UPI001B276446|nr:sugar phosphate nucleotidyltransferase [Paenibacillus sp. J2TS4]GIP36203.1 mannose-1-phosphate guanylyltransferase [Paenibacillus sp. J2TS4]
MRLVLLSGGSGKRLWPLSNDARSKQFLKVLRNEKGQLESMAQRVWRQLEEAGLNHRGYIATSREQVDMVQNQLGSEIPLIVEPERRDTFPAIALASVYLYSVAGVSLDEVIAVLPVDPYVETAFFHKVVQFDSLLNQTEADLALIGVRPTYPSEKYGYIVPSYSEVANHPGCLKVSHFQEKPSEREAEALIHRGALWNCGVFAFKLQYMIDLLISKGLPLQYEEMVMQYSRLTKISFDYEVAEKAGHVVVLPYEGSWKDLGTWNTLTEEMAQEAIGKQVRKEDSPGTHVINELDIPVVALGLSDVVVAASPDGILVADKSASPRIKTIMQHDELFPMYGEKAWGYYKVLEYMPGPPGSDVRIQKCFVKAGGTLAARLALAHSEVWTVLTGQGKIEVNGSFRYIHMGDVVVLPEEAEYKMHAFTDMEMVEVQYGMAPMDGSALKLGT